MKSHKEIVLDLGFIKLNVQKINDLIHFMFQGFVIKTKQTLSQSKASQPFQTACQLSKSQSYILLSKSQYSLLYNIAISSNRFVYYVKKFHTKVQSNMYLQYNFFFSYKRTSANPVCALYWTAAHFIKKLPALAVNICVYRQSQIRHWQGSKKIWSFLQVPLHLQHQSLRLKFDLITLKNSI